VTITGTSSANLPASIDEAGTAPEDRRFRPDVEGLRAIAIALVVLYHGGLSQVSGGYVGVDVFFVISGFVITGLLLREQATSRLSFLGFYGRRARRIIPAATVTIVVTVTLTYLVLGAVIGNQTAIDGKWAALFLANFHFTSIGTNYLTAQAPPSPLQSFWSLAVEEQFYFVYPALFLAICAVRTGVSSRARLVIALTGVVVVSFIWSVVQTASNPTTAYFSPLTRAWELALGALVALSTDWILKIPRATGCIMSWTGLGAIGFAALFFNRHTTYPGAPVALPVVGAALVIAGGTTVPRWAAESVLGLAPFRWLGRLSYSLYLWHWPILILAAEAADRPSLTLAGNLPWLALALAASIVSYYLIERPIRHSRFIAADRWRSLALGLLLVGASVSVVTVELDAHSSPHRFGLSARSQASRRAARSVADVMGAIRSAPGMHVLPTNLAASLGDVRFDWGGPTASCWPSVGQTTIPACVFGDPHGSRTMVLYGDSHAGMWFSALNFIAVLEHWRLAYLGKGYCGAAAIPYQNPPGWGRPEGEYAACDRWHEFAMHRIDRIKPDLVIVTQEVRPKPSGVPYTAPQWRDGLEKTLKEIAVSGAKTDVLGNIPILPWSGPQCLATHAQKVQTCSHFYSRDEVATNRAEQSAAERVGSDYIDTTPWFCSTICTAAIGDFNVYFDQDHVTAGYSRFLLPVLDAALHLSTITQ
jgi:peptidoglycan/LPS O-acetylase OafA/YrhL